MKRKKDHFGTVFFTGVFSLVLAAMTALFSLILFLQALGQTVKLPALGDITSKTVNAFFDSWLCIALGGVLVLLPLLIIVLMNTHRIFRIFQALGAAALLAAVLSGTGGLVLPVLANAGAAFLPDSWQGIFVNASGIFQDYALVVAVILCAVGAGCLSVSSCIRIVKGARHETNP